MEQKSEEINHQEILLTVVKRMEEDKISKGEELTGFYEMQIQPSLVEEYKKHNSKPQVLNTQYMDALLSDKIYLNPEITKIASHKINESFMCYSEIINKLFPGFAVDEKDYTISAKDETKTVNFSKFLEVIRSKDQAIYEENKWMFEDGTYQLDRKEDVPHLAYLSFPRSGNTFLRRYFESILNIASGKDTKLFKLSAIALQLIGMKGQGVADNRVWMVASHAPDPMPPSNNFKANRGLIMVRNPLDAIVSFFIMGQSGTHSHSIGNEFHLENPVFWDQYFKFHLHQWVGYHNYWIKRSQEEGIPIYFMRFEDMVRDPKPVLTELFQFCLTLPSLDGTVIEQRIDHAISKGKSATQAYKPRTGGSSGKNERYYTQEQIEYTKEVAGDLLYYFGYVSKDDNLTSFYDFPEHSEERLVNFYGFKQWNSDTLGKIYDEGDDSFKKRYEIFHKPDQYPNEIPFPGFDSGLKIDVLD